MATERPSFWIVAGPNGSGKSSLYGNTDIEAFDQSIWIINPDLLTRRLQEVEHLPMREANVQAVTRIETWLDASIAVHQTIGVETVLSTDKYRRLVTEAKGRGFVFRLIFVMLESVELNVQRVRIRVEKGGHDVPEDRIRARWGRSLAQLPWFLEEADDAALFDNSGAAPRLIGRKVAGQIEIDQKAPAALLQALGLVKPGEVQK
ncbi:MAG: zeta toxin family protein [Proteobacteria bacterium]|nr:zeta toxin family protein [Pseudomonadota bacterium]